MLEWFSPLLPPHTAHTLPLNSCNRMGFGASPARLSSPCEGLAAVG